MIESNGLGEGERERFDAHMNAFSMLDIIQNRNHLHRFAFTGYDQIQPIEHCIHSLAHSTSFYTNPIPLSACSDCKMQL